MARFDFEAQRGRAWWTSRGGVALTVAAGNTCMFYIRNLDQIRKVYIGRIFLAGEQSASWGFWTQPIAALSEAALGNFGAVQNTDLTFPGTRGIDGDCNVIIKAGDDGQDRAGGNSSAAILTRSYETRQIDLEGAISLGLGDIFAIVCDPQVDGNFSCTVGFWQKQDPSWLGA